LVGLVDVVMLVVIGLGLVYAVLVRPEPAVVVSNTTYHSRVDYQASATGLFQKLQNRNKISLNQAAVIKDLQAQFPEIASGEVELPLFSEKPTIRLSISPPVFQLKSQHDSLVIDHLGVAVAKSSQLPSVSNLPVIVDHSSFSPTVGKQVLSTDSVRFINNLLVQCRRSNIPLKSLSLPPRAEEVDLATKDQPYYVKFYLGGDPLVEAGQFLAARHQFETSGTQPSEYLDVRVPGKIFFK
jgi:hypothetical protein